MRTHADDQDEKPFGCHNCGARFNQRSQLTVHMVRYIILLVIISIFVKKILYRHINLFT